MFPSERNPQSDRYFPTAMQREAFAKFARKSAKVMGSPTTFAVAVGLIAVWGVSGFFVNFSEGWQLIAPE